MWADFGKCECSILHVNIHFSKEHLLKKLSSVSFDVAAISSCDRKAPGKYKDKTVKMSKTFDASKKKWKNGRNGNLCCGSCMQMASSRKV